MTFVKTIRKVNGYDASEATDAMLKTIKELGRVNGQLKQKNTTLTIKLTNARDIIKKLKVEVDGTNSVINKIKKTISIWTKQS